MKRRFEEMTKTGSSGPSNPLEEKLFKAMVDEADILGDTTSSSTVGIEVRGEFTKAIHSLYNIFLNSKPT